MRQPRRPSPVKVTPFAPTRRRSVALLIETSNDYARGLLQGVIQYIRAHGPWSTFLAEQGRGDTPPDWLSTWKGDGIIARVENRRIARAVIATGLPVVDVSAANLLPGAPWVETDDAAIARAAFDHLYERGFRSFAYCGDDRFNWSRWRCEHFRRLATAAGCPCAELGAAPAARVAAWIRGLPRPVGVMASYDALGRQILEACRQAGAAVPDGVAVVGVDDDELLCALSDPPLSSVAPDKRRTGYEAAALLDRMMAGEAVEARPYLIPPLGVTTRVSSDVLAVEDEGVSAAVRFIRERACEGIDVSDVVAAVPLGRRVLEVRFKRLVGRTPHDEIDRVKVERVKELLRETDLPLSEIARRTGYAHVEYMTVVFKKRAGTPPSTYRARHGRRGRGGT